MEAFILKNILIIDDSALMRRIISLTQMKNYIMSDLQLMDLKELLCLNPDLDLIVLYWISICLR